MVLLTEVLFVFLFIYGINCFNISPNPNIIVNEPQQNVNKSTYFGYAINLRKNSILIGAPKFTKDKKIEETGAVYKCEITELNDTNCYHYEFHKNVNAKYTERNYYLKSEWNEYQMLGSTMDGFGSETDKFVSCAPNFKNFHPYEYQINGACFMIQNSEKSVTENVTNIILTSVKNNQKYVKPGTKDKPLSNHRYAQQGFSVHCTEHSSEIIMGAPGVYVWSGSIIRYRGPRDFDIFRPMDTLSLVSSYFGYAVTSGLFNKPEDNKTYYVGSAPRATNYNTVGLVLIYDIQNKKFTLKMSLLGTQTGEYFGYSLLVEDFNNDGLPDLAVSAPMYSVDSYLENGAVYIYLNQGKMKFVIQPLITSKSMTNGRFGTALSKIGDINMDGYNDIAISAPFEGNGAVYIYLGGPEGLSLTPCQTIRAPIDDYTFVRSKMPMFGHSISRGVDIDNNGYNDIAIGDPSFEKVYIYRSYPVVKIIASIVPSKSEIFTNATSFTVKACAHHSSVMKSSINFTMTIIIDSKFNRAFFTPGNNQKSEEITLNDVESCWDHEITLIPKLTEVYEPLEVEMIFKILDNIPQSGNQFCDSCVIFDLKETATVSNKVAFITGCEGTQCVSELSLDGKIIDVTQPYIIGTTKTIVIQYELTNTGENAYLTQLMISIPTNVTQFSKTQPNCKLSNQNSLMTCSILDGKPIQRNQKIDLFISLDMSRIQGSSLRVNASVTCAGINSNEENSSTDNIIMFSELSEIQITSEKPKLNISVDDDESLKEITYTYKIINKGPSIVREMKIKIPIPIKYLTPKKELTIVDLEEGSISCQYDNNKFEVLMLDHVADDSLIYYSGGIEDQTASDLIDNKTIIFDCSNSSRIICTNAILEIPNFKSNNDIIDITIKLKVHLDNIDEIFRLEENYNTFLYKLNAKLHRVGEGKLIVSITNPYTLINASFTVITPYMIIGISIICGILVLLLVIYVLYRMGFFKRAKKAEINQYRRESRRMTQRIKEAALNPANDVEELEKEVFSNNDEMVKQLKSKQSKKNLTVEGTDEPRPSTSNKRASFRVEQSIVLDVNKK